eukprot:c14674_g1_i1 orf=195-434(+)
MNLSFHVCKHPLEEPEIEPFPCQSIIISTFTSSIFLAIPNTKTHEATRRPYPNILSSLKTIPSNFRWVLCLSLPRGGRG